MAQTETTKRHKPSINGHSAYRSHTVWVVDVPVCQPEPVQPKQTQPKQTRPKRTQPKRSLEIIDRDMQLLVKALTEKRHTTDEMCELLETKNKQHIYNMLSRIKYHQYHLISQRQNKWGPATYLITGRLQ